MGERKIDESLPWALRGYIGLVAASGLAVLVLLVARTEWDAAAVGEMCLFIVLVVVAGSFPLPVSQGESRCHHRRAVCCGPGAGAGSGRNGGRGRHNDIYSPQPLLGRASQATLVQAPL